MRPARPGHGCDWRRNGGLGNLVVGSCRARGVIGWFSLANVGAAAPAAAASPMPAALTMLLRLIRSFSLTTKSCCLPSPNGTAVRATTDFGCRCAEPHVSATRAARLSTSITAATFQFQAFGSFAGCSLGPDVRVLHDGPPLRNLGLVICGKRVRRLLIDGWNLHRKPTKALADSRVRKSGLHGGGELSDRVLRHALRRPQSVPHGHVKS